MSDQHPNGGNGRSSITLDESDAAAVAEELAQLGLFEMHLQPQTVLVLTGLLQLAKRHPQLDAQFHTFIDRFLAGVGEYFRNAPHALAVIAAGNDPAHDK